MFGRGYGRGFPGPGGPGMRGRGFARALGPRLFPGGDVLFLLVALVVLGLIVFALWRVFTKAGFNGAWSLLALVPFVGVPATLLFLALADWAPLAELAAFRAHGAQPVSAEGAAVPGTPAEPGTVPPDASERPTQPLATERGTAEPKGE